MRLISVWIALAAWICSSAVNTRSEQYGYIERKTSVTSSLVGWAHSQYDLKSWHVPRALANDNPHPPGTVNGLVQSGSAPLAELKLVKIYVAIWRHLAKMMEIFVLRFWFGTWIVYTKIWWQANASCITGPLCRQWIALACCWTNIQVDLIRLENHIVSV